MVALSVSISAITSPDLTASPSFLSHLARLPFSIVGESAGIRTLIGIVSFPSGLERKGQLRGLFGSRLSASHPARMRSKASSSEVSASSA